MVDHTDTRVFDFHSQVSTLALGDELKGAFQKSVQFDDTMLLDSPLVEIQLEKLDFDTQVRNDSDCFEDEKLQSNYVCEKEVVLDSEDEDICRTKTAGTANVLSGGNSSIDEQCGVGSKSCKVKVERTGEKKDLYMSSEEPGESSQASALEFVDQFLSLNKIDVSPEIGIKKTFLEKSLPVLSKKRSQSLITRTKFRKLEVSKSGTFDWTDTDQHGNDDVFSKRANTTFEFVALKQIPEMEDDKSERLDTEGGRSSGNEHEQKEELVGLEKEIAVSNQSDSGYFVSIGKETCKMEQVSKMNFKNSTVEEFNDLHAESPDQQLEKSGTGRDTPDMIDVGFNTQIAAEAMEALSKQSKCTARVSVIISNNDELDPGLALVTKVRRDTSLIGEQFDCTNSVNTKGTSGRRSPRLIIHGQVDDTVSRNSKQLENYMSSSISVERTEGKLKNTSIVSQDSPRDRAEDGIIKIRRKRSRLVGDPSKVVSTTGRWSELHSNSSAEAGNGILNQEEQTSRVVTATISCSKLDTWSHTKGKRTLRKYQNHSNRAINMYLPLAIVNRKEDNHCCVKSQRRAEDNDNNSCYNKCLDGKPQPVNSSSPFHPLEKYLGRSFVEPGSAAVIANSESASICKGITAAEVDDVNCLLSSNGAEKNHEFEVSSGKNLEPFRSGCRSTFNFTKGINEAYSCPMPSKYHEKSFNKNLPKSSLLKELIRLGVLQSIPDFTWKELRRRRDTAHVRVLFSQHLGEHVIKQQKKISARLGISTATSPLDATHFIADRFVRTRNMLELIALGKPVVTHLWLESCGQARCLIDETNYILRDAKKEKEIGFSMPVTFSRANQHPLLKGQGVFITPNINPNKEMIICLVKAVQGQVVEISHTSAVKDQNFEDNLLILSCEEDHSICMPFLDKGVAAYSSELLLNGIVIQKLEFERHKLFKDHSKRNHRSKKSRKDGVCFNSILR